MKNYLVDAGDIIATALTLNKNLTVADDIIIRMEYEYYHDSKTPEEIDAPNMFTIHMRNDVFPGGGTTKGDLVLGGAYHASTNAFLVERLKLLNTVNTEEVTSFEDASEVMSAFPDELYGSESGWCSVSFANTTYANMEYDEFGDIVDTNKLSNKIILGSPIRRPDLQGIGKTILNLPSSINIMEDNVHKIVKIRLYNLGQKMSIHIKNKGDSEYKVVYDGLIIKPIMTESNAHTLNIMFAFTTLDAGVRFMIHDLAVFGRTV